MPKQIDYLFEDPPIHGQKYALVTIVGPHMPQRCNVWGCKVRGFADSVEEAKQLTKRIMQIDNDYHIFIVEVGKFFPLEVEPSEIKNQEYINDQLNDLMKGYQENREQANQAWEKRKNELVKQARLEGQKQTQEKIEDTPLTIYNRMNEMKENYEKYLKDYTLAKQQYDELTPEEQNEAKTQMEAFKQKFYEEKQEQEQQTLDSIERIRQELIEELDKVDPLTQRQLESSS